MQHEDAGQIATCTGDTLIPRAADVVLKERRRLVLGVRESPLHEIHLQNMLKLTRMGVIIAPPLPAFYIKPRTIDELVDHTVTRMLDLFGIPTAGAGAGTARWTSRKSSDGATGCRSPTSSPGSRSAGSRSPAPRRSTRPSVAPRLRFQPGPTTPAHRRSAILSPRGRADRRAPRAFAETIAREAGKAWKHAANEVARSVETFTFAGEEAKRIHGETVPMDASAFGENRIGFYLRAPLGVVSAITPFNFPLNLVAHKVAPALAAGNTVVLKPAEETPLTAVLMADCLRDAGLPDGVLELVHGDGPTTGEALVRHPGRPRSRSPAARRWAPTSCSTRGSSASRWNSATTRAPSSSPTRTSTRRCRAA